MIRGLHDSLPGLLPAFLPEQRWFAGKSRRIARCEIEDAADLPGVTSVAVVIVAVSYITGPAERYVLLVSRRADPRGAPSVGPVGHPDTDWIVESATDPAAVAALLAGFPAGASLPTWRGGSLTYADVGETARRALADPAAAVKRAGGEQSNTSVRVGSTLVFKLFRRVEPGENPELEVGRFLTSRTSFRAMSPLEGSLTYLAPDQEASTLGVLQAWIDNDGDGWSFVLSALEECVRTGVPHQLVPDMTRLGAITAGLHAALESDDEIEAFRSEPVQAGDVDVWRSQLLDRASRVDALVEAHVASWDDETRSLAASLSLTTHLASITMPAVHTAPTAFRKIRIHGDYHLGQTLKTPTGFAIIDFEGEPARSLAERREKQTSLKDVAGMLRSFDYAIETASGRRPQVADHVRSMSDLRHAFLDGYLGTAAALSIRSVPSDRTALTHWLTFFELEKALYELEYEVNNRPEWACIPLRGILRTLETLHP